MPRPVLATIFGALTVMELGDHFEPIPVATAPRLDFWKRFFQTQDAW